MKPALSVIVTGRNDDHGADFTARLLKTARYNMDRLVRGGVAAEYLFVEWNPPPDRPWLAKQVVAEVPCARAYVCAPEIHAQLCTNPRMRILEFFAKNAGIRRTSAPFILTTNADIILGDNAIEFIASLSSRDAPVLWRATRHDVAGECPLEQAHEPAHRIHSYPLAPPFLTDGAGDFLLAHRDLYGAARGFDEIIRFAKIHKDGRYCIHCRLLGYDIRTCGDVFHLAHDRSWGALPRAEREAPDAPWGPQYDWQAGLPYCNAAAWGLADFPDRPVAENIVLIDQP